MSSAQRPPINWWNSEHQKQPESEADEIMPPISDGWFLTCKSVCRAYLAGEFMQGVLDFVIFIIFAK